MSLMQRPHVPTLLCAAGLALLLVIAYHLVAGGRR